MTSHSEPEKQHGKPSHSTHSNETRAGTVFKSFDTSEYQSPPQWLRVYEKIKAQAKKVKPPITPEEGFGPVASTISLFVFALAVSLFIYLFQIFPAGLILHFLEMPPISGGLILTALIPLVLIQGKGMDPSESLSVQLLKEVEPWDNYDSKGRFLSNNK